ncbi:hypothetical protein DI005_18195 [Prauserella sp. PE36]|nr:hypothetical protein DI005_18195 [Prauserella sp. PE36]
MHHYNSAGRVQEYDFAALPVAEPLQRSLAALFAARCTPHHWTVHASSTMYWRQLETFTIFLSQQARPPRDVDELTASLIERWRESVLATAGGYTTFTAVTSLLRGDPRLQTGPIADTLARRAQRPRSGIQSYSEAEFDRVKLAARRMFRAALLRIEHNAAHLQRWQAGEFTEGSRDWVLGEALDVLARTGDLIHYPGRRARGGRGIVYKYRKAFGGMAAAVTWQRLFLSRMEATALGVLLLAEFGWNLSVIDRAAIPRALPDPGEDGRPTYRIPIEKRRRGAGRFYETRNVTDDGAASPGRLITQALAATRFARAVVADRAPDVDLLVVWRTHVVGRERADGDRQPPVGPFHFGVHRDAGARWARTVGLRGSPFQRGRQTVNALNRREPGQNSQDTHDRHYVLVDKRVQSEAVAIIAAGADEATAHARRAVLVAELRDAPDPGDVETATADCANIEHSPYPAAGGGSGGGSGDRCGASFLMCLGCVNARIHPGHHGRLAHLHHAVSHLRSVQAPTVWDADWGETHARLDDLKTKLGATVWTRAKAQVTDTDRELIDLMLTGDLDT